jgi:phosphoribosylamine--glycine ligase
MRYTLISQHGDGLGLIWQLAREGNDVSIYFLDKSYSYGLKDMIPQASSLSEAIKNKEGIIIFDMVGQGLLADRLRKAGHKVIGAGMGRYGSESLSDKLELDRSFGLEMMDSLKIRIPSMARFKQIDDALEFVKAHPGRWVIKPSGNLPTDMTFVPKDMDQLIGQLEKWKKERAIKRDFVLQKYVAGIEVSTEVFFSNGFPILPPNSTLETKRFLNDNLGGQTGCQTSVVWGYREKEPRLYQKSLKKAIGLIKGTGYTGPLDINGIVSDRDGQLYGLEWCPRFGYNAVYAMTQVLDMELGKFLSDLVEGSLKEIPWKSGFGGAVRVTVPPYPFDSTDKSLKVKIYAETKGLEVDVDFKDRSYLPLDVMAEDGRYKVAGTDGVVLEVLGYGRDLADLGRDVYNKAFKVGLANRQFRTDMSREARERWEGLVKKEYLRGKNNGIGP